MDRETVLRLASECTLVTKNMTEGVYVESLERFAALVAAHEREACAQVCEAKGQVKGGEIFAARIRARGEK